MFVKSSFCDGCELALIHCPETECYEFRYRLEKGLYLQLPGRDVLLMPENLWREGRPKLPSSAVEDLCNAIVEEIARLLSGSEAPRVIDIDEIYSKLMAEKFEQEWVDRGYITLDADGSW